MCCDDLLVVLNNVELGMGDLDMVEDCYVWFVGLVQVVCEVCVVLLKVGFSKWQFIVVVYWGQFDSWVQILLCVISVLCLFILMMWLFCIMVMWLVLWIVFSWCVMISVVCLIDSVFSVDWIFCLVWLFSVLVVLFRIRMGGFFKKVWVIVMCCFCLFDSMMLCLLMMVFSLFGRLFSKGLSCVCCVVLVILVFEVFSWLQVMFLCRLLLNRNMF